MSDQPPAPNQDNPPTPPAPLDWREERRLRREERRAGRSSSGAWFGGAVLIILGVLILLRNTGVYTLENWWALFILLPAVGAFGNAWRTYQNAGGRLTGPARSSLIGGLVLTMVAAIFLFNLNWGILGPILLILAGIGILLNTFLPG